MPRIIVSSFNLYRAMREVPDRAVPFRSGEHTLNVGGVNMGADFDRDIHFDMSVPMADKLRRLLANISEQPITIDCNDQGEHFTIREIIL